MSEWHEWTGKGAPVAPDQMYCNDPSHRWQPISTAPRDGRNVLLCKVNASHVFMGAAKTMGGTATYWFDTTGHMREPTHWQPLPAPPRD